MRLVAGSAATYPEFEENSYLVMKPGISVGDIGLVVGPRGGQIIMGRSIGYFTKVSPPCTATNVCAFRAVR